MTCTFVFFFCIFGHKNERGKVRKKENTRGKKENVSLKQYLLIPLNDFDVSFTESPIRNRNRSLTNTCIIVQNHTHVSDETGMRYKTNGLSYL